MSQAENLLDSLTEDDVTPYTAEPQTEGYIVIGRDRFITVPESLKRIAVQDDNNIETVTFECPRYWDENDLSEMQIFINYRRPDDVTGSYIAKNVKPQGDMIYFDWTIESHVTEFKGQLDFLVCAKATDEEGLETLHWNSELNRDMYISEGLEVEGEVVTQNPAIITQLLTRMDEVEAMAVKEEALKQHVANATAAVARAEAAVATATDKAEDMSALFEKFERVESVNRLNGNLTDGWISADGTENLDGPDEVYSYTYRFTNYIPVNEGEVITLQVTPHDRILERFIGSMDYVAAYDADMTILPSLGFDTPRPQYTVPAGVAYIRVSSIYLRDDYYFDRAVVASETVIPYEEYVDPGYGELKPENVMTTTSQLGNAIKGSVRGEFVKIDDISPAMHNIDCWVHGKNLFDGVLNKGILRSSSFEVDMTDSEVYRTIKMHVPKPGVYTVSFSKPVYIARLVKDRSYVVTSGYSNVSNYTFTVKTAEDVGITFRDAVSSDTLWDDTNTVHIEQGSIPTEYEPYIDPTTIIVTKFGKNLFDVSKKATTETVNGVTITRIGDQIKLNGTLTTDSNLFNSSFYLFGGLGNKYTLSYVHDGGVISGGMSSICVGAKDTTDSTSSRQSWLNITMKNENDSFTNTLSCPYIKDFWFYVKAGTKFEDYRIRIQLEVGDTATEYETAKSEVYRPNGNGLVNVLSESNIVTIFTNYSRSVVECEYNRDTGKAIDNTVKEYTNTTFANALEGSKTGEAIALTDVSPVEHVTDVKVRSKNLIPFPYANTTVTRDGITFTVNDDRSVTVNGTATSATTFVISNATSGLKLEHGVTYTLSGKGGNISVAMAYKIADGTYKYQTTDGSVTWDDSYTFVHIYYSIPNGSTFDGLVLPAPQFERGTVATDYVPYVPDISAVKVKKYGKNLYSHDSTLTHTKNTTMSVEVSEGKTYTASAILATEEGLTGRIRWRYTLNGADAYTQDGIFTYSGKSSSTLTVPSGATNVSVLFQVGGGTGERTWTNIQVEVGDTATEYEPYVEPVEYSVSEDGTVEGMTSIYPTTTLITDTEGAVIDCKYNRDANKVIADLESKIDTLLATIAAG